MNNELGMNYAILDETRTWPDDMTVYKMLHIKCLLRCVILESHTVQHDSSFTVTPERKGQKQLKGQRGFVCTRLALLEILEISITVIADRMPLCQDQLAFLVGGKLRAFSTAVLKSYIYWDTSFINFANEYDAKGK